MYILSGRERALILSTIPEQWICSIDQPCTPASTFFPNPSLQLMLPFEFSQQPIVAQPQKAFFMEEFDFVVITLPVNIISL